VKPPVKHSLWEDHIQGSVSADGRILPAVELRCPFQTPGQRRFGSHAEHLGAATAEEYVLQANAHTKHTFTGIGLE